MGERTGSYSYVSPEGEVIEVIKKLANFSYGATWM